jgi:hypothetical protein
MLSLNIVVSFPIPHGIIDKTKEWPRPIVTPEIPQYFYKK